MRALFLAMATTLAGCASYQTLPGAGNFTPAQNQMQGWCSVMVVIDPGSVQSHKDGGPTTHVQILGQSFTLENETNTFGYSSNVTKEIENKGYRGWVNVAPCGRTKIDLWVNGTLYDMGYRELRNGSVLNVERCGTRRLQPVPCVAVQR